MFKHTWTMFALSVEKYHLNQSKWSVSWNLSELNKKNDKQNLTKRSSFTNCSTPSLNNI